MLNAAGPPTPVPSYSSVHLNSAVATALVIGIPSLVVAIATYWLATRAHSESANATRVQIDAEAYSRARELYESAITSLREQVADLRAEVARLRDELADMRRRTRR